MLVCVGYHQTLPLSERETIKERDKKGMKIEKRVKEKEMHAHWNDKYYTHIVTSAT